MPDNQTKRTIASLLLLLFLSFQSGRTLCYHTHVFGNVVISHSHPFNNPDSQHSADELLSLSVVTNNLLTDDLTLTPLLCKPVERVCKLAVAPTARIASTHLDSVSGRDPPLIHI